MGLQHCIRPPRKARSHVSLCPNLACMRTSCQTFLHYHLYTIPRSSKYLQGHTPGTKVGIVSVGHSVGSRTELFDRQWAASAAASFADIKGLRCGSFSGSPENDSSLPQLEPFTPPWSCLGFRFSPPLSPLPQVQPRKKVIQESHLSSIT